jgi:hypothetical protein
MHVKLSFPSFPLEDTTMPNCTFCDIFINLDINVEAGLNLSYEWVPLHKILLNKSFSELRMMILFDLSRREFFVTFKHKDFGYARNLALTIHVLCKLSNNMLGAQRNCYSVPTEVSCWESISCKISNLCSNNEILLNKSSSDLQMMILFYLSQREFFATFKRRDFGYAKNLSFTVHVLCKY